MIHITNTVSILGSSLINFAIYIHNTRLWLYIWTCTRVKDCCNVAIVNIILFWGVKKQYARCYPEPLMFHILIFAMSELCHSTGMISEISSWWTLLSWRLSKAKIQSLYRSNNLCRGEIFWLGTPESKSRFECATKHVMHFYILQINYLSSSR